MSKRLRVVSFRMSDEEYATISTAATQSGVSVSELLRGAALRRCAESGGELERQARLVALDPHDAEIMAFIEAPTDWDGEE